MLNDLVLNGWNDRVFFFLTWFFMDLENCENEFSRELEVGFFSIIYRPSWNLRSRRAHLKCNSNVSSFFPLTGAGIENRDTEADTAS